MKSPAELKERLRRQWKNADKREARLLGGQSVWPLVIRIGRPQPTAIESHLDAVREHINAWRLVDIGETIWELVSYRAAAERVEIPIEWKLRQPTEWIRACEDRDMRTEFESMAILVEDS